MAAEGESLAAPLLERSAGRRDQFVEVRLYRRGAGPVAIFRSDLSGPRRDRLDVRRIQANHGLRALYAFKPEGSRRGLRIRCDPAAGYSALPFRDGAAIALDGEPKVSEWPYLSLPICTSRYMDIPRTHSCFPSGIGDEAGVADRRRPAGACADGGGSGQRGAGAAAIVEGDQRDLPAVDPRQRGHHLRSRQDAAKSSVSPGSRSSHMNVSRTRQFLSL